jgi:trans-aconitate 2-methyltransferase
VDSLTEPLACGLGPSGSLVALDLSPKSVEVARRRLARFACVHLLAADVLEVVPRAVFDVIVLPCVVEHIPVKHHSALFTPLSSWLQKKGLIAPDHPNPRCTAWCQTHIGRRFCK